MGEVNNKVHINFTPEVRARACQRIIDPSRPTFSFYLMVCLSAVIATFGLLSNSAAVVIGAMLVAPLMSPIFGIALALSNGDRKLLKTALFAEVVGIILAVSLPALIGLIPLRPDFGTEIIARTQPTIYDIMIALAAGFAGAYALVDEKISPALPGVAIATAVVPPLASCGLNIAAGNWSLAGGAFSLFLANFIAIEFASALTFMLSGLVTLPSTGNGSTVKAMTRRLGISFVILVLATIFMTKTLITIVGEKKLDKDIRSVLSGQLTSYAGARLSDVLLSQTNDGLQVVAVVITPQEFDTLRVASLEKSLQEQINPNTYLIVRSMVTKDADRTGPVFISAEEIKLRYQTIQETDFLNNVSRVLSQQIKTIDGAQMRDLSKDVRDGTIVITANITTPKVITPAEVQSIQKTLNREIDGNLRLVVRSVLTTDADATHFINNKLDLGEVLQGEELDYYKRLLNEINWYLSQKFAGATVTELKIQQSDDSVNVYSALETPFTLTPAMVAALQQYLQTYIDPRIRLTVRSVVGGTATAEAYTTSAN